MYSQLIAALETGPGDDVRVVVLAGRGRAFCAGADLKAHRDERPPDQRRAYVELAQHACAAVQACPVPVVAAVHGYALGAGAELALSADLLMMAEDAHMGFPELSLGTYVGGGITYRLPRSVGLARATQLLLVGARFSGQQALDWGLAYAIVPAEELWETTDALAGRLGALAPLSVAFAKRHLAEAAGGNPVEARQNEAEAILACMETADWAEGIAAYAEHRSPPFHGSMMESTLHRILNPRSVAVVGASQDRTKRGYQAVRGLIDNHFAGPIYPINPTAAEVAGLTAYPSVGAVAGPIDLALIVTPAQSVPTVLRECAVKGVLGAVVIAVGFAESGASGSLLQADIAGIARREGIRLIGPNTSGLFNLPTHLNLVGIRGVPEGRIALLSQSGNVALAMIAEGTLKSAQGFSVYIGVGNEVDLTFQEYLEYLRDDPNTAVVAVYAEGFRDGRAFLREARLTVPDTPVVIHKAGRSVAGGRTIESHTGALAGDLGVAESALRQAGVISVRRSDQLFAAAEVLMCQPPLRSPRVAVLADGGGHAAMAVDALSECGLVLPNLSDDTQHRLRGLLPAAAAVGNPVDVVGGVDRDPGLFGDLAGVILADPDVDGLLLVGLFGGYSIRFSPTFEPVEMEAARVMAAVASASGKPFVVQSAYAGARPATHILLRELGVPVHESIDVAASCLSALNERGRFLRTAHERSTFWLPADRRADTPSPVRALTEPEARAVLEPYGLPLHPGMVARDPEEAARIANGFGRPVALKIVSRDVIHKSDVGGVLLDVAPSEAGTRFDELLARVSKRVTLTGEEGVLVSPMAPAGLELIVGVTDDNTWGPVIMVGLGGVLVELLGDVSTRVLPITRREAAEMLDELVAAKLLAGYRGGPPLDRGAVVDLLCTVSRLIEERPDIVELDLNPVILYEHGLTVVDTRIIASDGIRAVGETLRQW